MILCPIQVLVDEEGGGEDDGTRLGGSGFNDIFGS